MKYKLKRFKNLRIKRESGVKIVKIDNFSPLKKVGIKKGFSILTINKNKINDYLDFYYYFNEFGVNTFEFYNPKGEKIILKLFLEEDERIGIHLEPIKPKICKNDCIFCFVSQHPKIKGIRRTLLIKDDDYRLSFLDGNFITLSNITEEDIDRICNQKLWPLYLSVHTMNKDLRKFMMKCRGSDFFYVFDKLCKCGVKFHTQIVLCPEINDGKELDNTIRELFKRKKNVLSIGIVPVGLTGHRSKLFKIKPITKEYSKKVISQVNKYHRFFRKKLGYGFIYLADEFYLKAKEMVPGTDYYDDFPQIENGIGMVREFLDEFNEIFLNDKKIENIKNKNFSIITGESFFPILEKNISYINNMLNLNINVFCVKNFFFGGEVTVAGLLTGIDIVTALSDVKKEKFGDFLCVPGESLMASQDIFLDNMSIIDLEETLNIKVMPLRYGPKALKKIMVDKTF